jgi:hypothetical protein
MAPKDVDTFIKTWKIDEEIAFYYYEYLLEEEILTIVRRSDDLFEVNIDKSSVFTGDWNKNEMEKILSRDGIVTYKVNVFGRYWVKSGGCECGAWRTGDPDCHSNWCPKHRG